jgi:hypothetical protein
MKQHTFGILPDEADRVSDIYELTEWLIRKEFLPDVKQFYEHKLPYKHVSELISFLSGQLYGAHLVWTTVTGDRINSDQLWEISRVIAWMVEYKPGAEWMKHFECMMDNLIQAMRLAADQEGENEQIEKA